MVFAHFSLACSNFRLCRKPKFQAKLSILSPCLLIKFFDLPMQLGPRSLKIRKLRRPSWIDKSKNCNNKQGLKIDNFKCPIGFGHSHVDISQFGKVLLVNYCKFKYKTTLRSIFGENGENFIYKTYIVFIIKFSLFRLKM